MERVQGVIKIKNREQCEDMKASLDEYVRQYRWVCNTENPFETILKTLDTYSEKLKSDSVGEDEKAEVLGDAHSLKGIFASIKANEYKPFLLRNIMSIVLSVEDFEASLEHRSPFNIISGVVKGDAGVKDFLKRKYAFYMTRVTGSLAAPADPRLEKVEDIISFISRNYELYGLLKEEVQEMMEDKKAESEEAINPLLLPVVSDKKVDFVSKVRMDILTKFLNEQGMNYDGSLISKDVDKASEGVASDEKAPGKGDANHERNNDEKHVETSPNKGHKEHENKEHDNRRNDAIGKDHDNS